MAAQAMRKDCELRPQPQREWTSCPLTAHEREKVGEFSARIRPHEGLKLCTWKSAEPRDPSPHPTIPLPEKTLIMDSVLDAIGNTPMVRLSRFAEAYGIQCELLGKCEFLSPGGSVKDRIGKRMVLDAEKSGKLSRGTLLIEPTSGNTGIGLALAATVQGHNTMIVLPEKMSAEKENILKCLQAKIVRTPTGLEWNDQNSHMGIASKLEQYYGPNARILDQYDNPSNPLAHYDDTAEEIILQCEGNVDMVIMTVGTGGTITGIGRKFKEKIPSCKIIGVDPYGSLLAEPASLNEVSESYTVEGIGYDFLPTTLDRSVVDSWVKSDDKTSLRLARELIRYEGLLCGGSCGAALVGVLKAAKSLRKDQRCVVLLPDSSRNYMTKFISEEWMIDRQYLSLPSSDFYKNTHIAEFLNMNTENDKKESEEFPSEGTTNSACEKAKIAPALVFHASDTFAVAIKALKMRGTVAALVGSKQTEKEQYKYITADHIEKALRCGDIRLKDTLDKIAKDVRVLQADASLNFMSHVLDVHPYVAVLHHLPYLLSKLDLLGFSMQA